jgi:hypothetical protein
MRIAAAATTTTTTASAEENRFNLDIGTAVVMLLCYPQTKANESKAEQRIFFLHFFQMI